VIFKFVWPDRPDIGDLFLKAPYVDLTPNSVGNINIVLDDGRGVALGAEGLRVYLLDDNGNTIDKPKVGGTV
jgi:hypothetical protein